MVLSSLPQINREVENIGARRLHTIIERLMEDLSFSATDRAGEKVVIDAETVQERVSNHINSTTWALAQALHVRMGGGDCSEGLSHGERMCGTRSISPRPPPPTAFNFIAFRYARASGGRTC
eukprot:scaffold193901_cov35-Tisochrysis_lutea.AAC.1